LRLLRVLAGLGTIAMVVPGCASAPAPAARPAYAAALDAELSAIVEDPAQPLAGLSVLAVRGGEVVYEGQFGRRYIDPADSSKDKPVTRETLYRIASISKLVTTLGVMRLVESGALDLDADVSRYLGWRLRNPHFPEVAITLRMLLSHTSSLRDDAGYYGWPPGSNIRDFLVPGGTLYGEGKMWSPRAKPGEWFSYANLPWGVVGTVMEKASGERYDRLMRRLVIEPLGLSGGFEPADFSPKQLDNLATLYRKRDGPEDREVWNPREPWVAQVDDFHAKAPVHRAPPGYEVGSNGILFGPQGNLRASAVDLGARHAHADGAWRDRRAAVPPARDRRRHARAPMEPRDERGQPRLRQRQGAHERVGAGQPALPRHGRRGLGRSARGGRRLQGRGPPRRRVGLEWHPRVRSGDARRDGLSRGRPGLGSGAAARRVFVLPPLRGAHHDRAPPPRLAPLGHGRFQQRDRARVRIEARAHPHRQHELRGDVAEGVP
jgi:CubicO group peptidase (beta-lactamase class C family)